MENTKLLISGGRDVSGSELPDYGGAQRGQIINGVAAGNPGKLKNF